MKNKPDYKKLFYSIIFDALGLLSFTIPMIGEFEDIIWAPISYWLMTKMYTGVLGKVSGIISFIEEAIPGTDFIPTFTITWFIDNYYQKKINSNQPHNSQQS